jgi:hypothetical protein|tara:strand:+ start:1778 stop:2035 length:258 start_codon:yes stop_codon:yes gene_type:complete
VARLKIEFIGVFSMSFKIEPSAIKVHKPPIKINKHQYQYSDLVARPENVAYLLKQLEIACPKFMTRSFTATFYRKIKIINQTVDE